MNQELKENPFSNGENIGKIASSVDKQHICYDCGESEAGYYFEIRNKETGDVEIICEDCQSQLFRF